MTDPSTDGVLSDAGYPDQLGDPPGPGAYADDGDGPTPALGAVVETDRGSLPFSVIHGEALVACAAWAMAEAGVTTVDLGTGWEAITESGEAFVLHDALCPMTPASFLADCVARAVETGHVVVGARPVTDTVKTVDDDDSGEGPAVVGGTVDRDELREVASPIVLPAAVVAGLDGLPTTDFADLVGWLRDSGAEVELAQAPPAGRRVGSEEELRQLEALTAPD